MSAFESYKQAAKKFPLVFCGNLLRSLIVFLGLLVFIFPGIYAYLSLFVVTGKLVDGLVCLCAQLRCPPT